MKLKCRKTSRTFYLEPPLSLACGHTLPVHRGGRGHSLPGAVLSAAVDVGAVIQQVLNDGEPAAGTRLVQGAVAGVVSVVHVTHSVLQAVENHLLKTG